MVMSGKKPLQISVTKKKTIPHIDLFHSINFFFIFIRNIQGFPDVHRNQIYITVNEQSVKNTDVHVNKAHFILKMFPNDQNTFKTSHELYSETMTRIFFFFYTRFQHTDDNLKITQIITICLLKFSHS